ncbi:MAG: EamA family transporter [Bacteroidota bacterium]
MAIYFILIFQQLIASSTHLIAKSATTEIHPALVVFLRGGFAALAYAVWWVFKRKDLPKFERSDLKKLLILGLINIPINQLLFIWGLRFTTAPNASLAYALTPAFVLLTALAFTKERTTRLKVIGIVVAFVGITIVLFERDVNFSSGYFLGNIMVLGASLSWAWFTLLGRDFAKKYGAIYSTALAMFMGWAMYIPFFIGLHFFADVPFNIGDLSGTNWFQIFYLGVITSGVGYALWNYALTKTDASKVAVFNNMQPILTTILSIIFLSQEPSHIFVIGGLVAIVGVVLTQRG